MAINIGPTLRRRREWARLTQQELVEHTRLERSASYISAIETGRTSPTLEETERLARYFRMSLIEFLQEALEEGERRAAREPAPLKEEGDPEHAMRAFLTLSAEDRELALDFMELLARRARR